MDASILLEDADWKVTDNDNIQQYEISNVFQSSVPKSEQEALQNLDRFVSLKLHYLDLESSRFGNIMDVKRFVKNAITEFLATQKKQHCDLIKKNMSELIGIQTSYTIQNHTARETESVRKYCKLKSFGKGQEMLWIVNGLDMIQVIQQQIKLQPQDTPLIPIEKGISNTKIQTGWTPGNVNEYFELWKDIVCQEKVINEEKSKKEKLNGVATQRLRSEKFLQLNVCGDLILKY